ncbi:site-specific integrase [Phocaeicola vulgatus]|uniref:Site-specific integrase n=2 Tax=Phocaeicola TaxID=909656 RepID=A0A7J5QYE3_PHOVU|nr:site-specific integrase [Phocaeicola dorei]KAB6459782.1 site-specific integrase [Phocaeicola vulgatus]KAA5310784.1 site-specific integrase [Phocaeicola dorei]KAB6467524.1 site-specific integrase [Phocaeicola vulgatus]KAB6495574.1 site-specific integrase [Phocaeicola vulgatus]KAB6508309.1 site-specific integrase [Phocaeicola vulgatus]
MTDRSNKDNKKSPVKIRFKAMKDGRRSIYLDCYRNGHRSYEYLKLYLVPETDDTSLRLNEATMRKAETACRKKLRELKKLPVENRRIMETQGYISNKDISILEWLSRFKEIQRSRGVHDIHAIDLVCAILSEMNCGDTKVNEIGKDFCIAFVEYLKTGYKTAKGENLKPKTAFNRQCTFVTALNVAVREGIIPTNPMNLLSHHERAKASKGKRDYLTIDEVKRLIATPCKNNTVKNAYLFACNCGLRLGDVRKLKWGDITQDNGRWILSVIMNKSEKPIHIPLGVQARRWIPGCEDSGKHDTGSLVFEHLPGDSHINDTLKIWAADAGITKSVTYHTSRHTFATMLLTLGADLYTVSKLLGHSQIKNTQIYAEIINRRKDEAVNLIDKVFD